jgi:hypothetical protein
MVADPIVFLFDTISLSPWFIRPDYFTPTLADPLLYLSFAVEASDR